jgi:hypothetical protein
MALAARFERFEGSRLGIFSSNPTTVQVRPPFMLKFVDGVHISLVLACLQHTTDADITVY